VSRLVYRGLAVLCNRLQGWLLRRPVLYKALFANCFSGLRGRVGVWRAWLTVERAYAEVPAYRDFLDERGGLPRLRLVAGLPDLSVLPETDKASYVQRYDHRARCVGGALPRFGVVVDESSGSSGRPTNWVRGPEERAVTKAMLQLSFRSALGDASFFVINGFSLGAWATGLNVTQSLNDICIMKSTGPDIDRIVGTLQEFGPDYDYVVLGYPPFLKTLSDDRRIDWSTYRVRAVFGGEAMSEPMRAYLRRSFVDVVGSYGASDLEINIAVETPFTIAVRQQLQHDATLRERLTDPSLGTLPMVLQYNPLAYVLETNARGELLVTLTRPTIVAPKVRYNIHDLGHVAPFEDVASSLRELGHSHLVDATSPVMLPLLFLYGRSDQSVDYYGANVTPDSVHEILFQVAELASSLESFRLISVEDEQQNKTIEIAVELNEGADPASLDAAGLGQQVFARLARMNGDFRNAYYKTATEAGAPLLSLHAKGAGPFSGAERIKRQYVDAAAR
jgi:phenylacetate-CoA ligase